MEQNNRKNKLMIIVFALLLIGLISIAYGFFNYTRTGALNNLGTGQINFASSQSDTLNITNYFPMTEAEAGNANLDAVTISISGDTTYADGEEFEISIVDVTNTVNGKKVPINYIATYTAETGGTIGTSNNDYWEDRNDKDSSIYLLNATGSIMEGKQVLVGYIDNGTTGINGELTISAYIDADRIAISDTYYENAPSPSISPTPSGISIELKDYSTLIPSKLGDDFPDIQVVQTPSPTPGPTDEYGTTTEWVDGRVILTTDEWNSLSSNPINFKIRVESNEGIWVEENGKINSCTGCKFMFLSNDTMYTTWNTQSETPTEITTGLYDNYLELLSSIEADYFLGVKLNEQNQVTNAYACGVKDGVPFCIEGTADGSKYDLNSSLINGSSLWSTTCTINTIELYSDTVCGLWDDNLKSISSNAISDGYVVVGVAENDFCVVDNNGFFGCSTSIH